MRAATLTVRRPSTGSMKAHPDANTGTFHRLLRRVACAVLFGPIAGVVVAAEPAKLHATMADELRAQSLQGAVWSTVDGHTIAVDAAGIRDARSRAPMQPGDRVHVGSVAKTLLATGVLRLVTQGRLSLDTPVAPMLPQIAFDNPWASTDPIRIRHLLDHTAGLDDARLSQVFSLHARADAPLADAFAGRGPLRVRSRPGARHSYSNTGYTLLGMVVETVTGARYEHYLDRELLQPLQMLDSTFAFTTQAGPHADARLAMGHFEDGVRQAAVPSYVRPAGQFTTTAEDMGRLARFLMGDGRIGDAPFVDVALLRAMGEPTGTEAAAIGLRVGNGLGLFTRDRHGAVGKCHGGSTVGYRAMFCLFPQQRRAFFVSINADLEGANYGRIDRNLIDALQLPQPVERSRTPATADIADWEGIYVPAPNRFATFEWMDTTLNFVRVRREGDALRFTPFQSDDLVLRPAGGALLRAPERTIASHALIATHDGERVISTGTQSYRRTSLSGLVLLWASLVFGLLGASWLLLSGVFALLMRRGTPNRTILIPFAGMVALLLPLPFFLGQSFLQLGDLTMASGLLAIVTALLPVTMLAGLFLNLRHRPWPLRTRIDVAAMLAVLQWTVVLAVWGLLPLRLWA